MGRRADAGQTDGQTDRQAHATVRVSLCWVVLIVADDDDGVKTASNKKMWPIKTLGLQQVQETDVKPDRKQELQLNISFLTKTERVPCLGILTCYTCTRKEEKTVNSPGQFPSDGGTG